MDKITLTPPTYTHLYRHPEMDHARFRRNLKWLGRECFLAFGESQRMSCQKVHTAVWRIVIAELQERHGAKMGPMSKVVVEGYNGKDTELNIRVRSEHGKFKRTSGYVWNIHSYAYSEVVTDEVGPSYWDLYVPPKSAMTPMVFKSPVRKSRSNTTKEIERLIRD